MNREIELHDSRVACLRSEENQITLVFEPAYIHQSEGRPGIDAGTGWTQNCTLVFNDASLEGNMPELPCNVMDGNFTIGSKVHRNSIPLPPGQQGPVSLRLVFYPGCELTISGASVELQTTGRLRFAENFWPDTKCETTTDPHPPQNAGCTNVPPSSVG